MSTVLIMEKLHTWSGNSGFGLSEMITCCERDIRWRTEDSAAVAGETADVINCDPDTSNRIIRFSVRFLVTYRLKT